MTNFESVRKFHTAFGQPVNDTPRIPADERCDLRIELIDEEFKELKDAITAKDIVGIADALTDILYVTYGAGLEFGVDLDACFAEVQRSNMSKLGEDGKPIYREDGKVLKGPSYSPPDLKAVLEKQVLEKEFAEFVKAGVLTIEQRETEFEFDGVKDTYEYKQIRNGDYSWADEEDVMSYDFNRDIGHPGDEKLEDFKEEGVVAIRVDDDFWVHAVLPYKFLPLDCETLVKHLWPNIYENEEIEFKPDAGDPWWDNESEE